MTVTESFEKLASLLGEVQSSLYNATYIAKRDAHAMPSRRAEAYEAVAGLLETASQRFRAAVDVALAAVDVPCDTDALADALSDAVETLRREAEFVREGV